MSKELFYKIHPKIDKGNYGLCPQKLPDNTIFRVLKDEWDAMTNDEKEIMIMQHLHTVNEFQLSFDILCIEEF